MMLKNLLFATLLVSFTQCSPTPQTSGASSAVGKAITDITKSLTGLKGKVNAWNGDVVQASNVLLDAKDLLTVISTSTNTISGLPMLPLNEAVNVLQPANALIKEAQGTVDGLIAKKPGFDQAKLTPVVKNTLTDFKTGADKMVGAVMKVLPDNVKTVGTSIGKQIDATLDKGIKAYS